MGFIYEPGYYKNVLLMTNDELKEILPNISGQSKDHVNKLIKVKKREIKLERTVYINGKAYLFKSDEATYINDRNDLKVVAESINIFPSEVNAENNPLFKQKVLMYRTVVEKWLSEAEKSEAEAKPKKRGPKPKTKN